MNEKQKYKSGISGKAEARFGGKIYIEPVRFTNGDGIVRYGLTLSEFYNGSEVGSIPKDQRTHEPQIQLVFDNIKSVDIMEMKLATVRETMKRDAEKEEPSDQLSPEEKLTDDEKCLKRMTEEYDQLAGRLHRLQAFRDTDTYKQLPENSRYLLDKQCKAMDDYESTLKQLIQLECDKANKKD